MSACRGDFQPSRLRHFQVVSRSISINCLYSRACTYFHFISSLFTFVFFSLFLKLPCESKNLSPESYVFVPSIRNRTRNRILSSVFTRRLPR